MAQVHDTYREVGLQTASPPRLLLALYDGAVRFLGRAQTALERRDREAAHENLIRTQAILIELMATLDLEYGEIPQQLMDLYIYMHRTLVEANIHKDTARVREVDGLVRKLRDAWRGAVAEVERTGALLPGAPGGAG